MKSLDIVSIVLTLIGGAIIIFFSLNASYASRSEVEQIRDNFNKQMTTHVDQNKDDMTYIRVRLDEVYRIVLKQRECE